MRKEIAGIAIFFLVIFTLISLLSYTPADPSLHRAADPESVDNLFGVAGAHLAGALVSLFGLGAFWVPVLLLVISTQFFGHHPRGALIATVAGGLVLVVVSGSLVSVWGTPGEAVTLFGRPYPAGGWLGEGLRRISWRYMNQTGGTIVLVFLWLVGLILATGFSLVRFARRLALLMRFLGERVDTFRIKHQQRRLKAVKRKKTLREQATRPPAKITIQTPAVSPILPTPVPKQEVFDFMHDRNGFQLPSVSLLTDPEPRPSTVDDENLKMKSRLLEKKLEDFGVHGQVTAVLPGPVITTFEYEPAPGVKINRVAGLADDLAMALRATSIRIVAPIPGKAAIGIEIPNTDRELVRFKEVVISPVFDKSKSPLTLCLGKDIVGNPVVADLERMPHLLIAGATGTGKSVGLNAMICSLLYKAGPEEIKFIMIDPKRIELSLYDGIPHLITPVVTDVKKATNALFWAVREMERRYALLQELKVRNLKQYNQKAAKSAPDAEGKRPEKLPLIVIIIDELADLMMVASRDVEVALIRLAQMARASGIHLILATQRPSVDVLTGIIKANFPTRLTFQVSSRTDSRTIIDSGGAENLLGNGDMLLLPPGTAKLQRIHGAFISEEEVSAVVDFLKSQKPPDYIDEVTAKPEADDDENGGETEYDEHYDNAVALVTRTRQASISMIQRHLRIGYNRAARIIETMEREGVVGPADGAKPREVLARNLDETP
jgi:S-DNA-T family DNA segregation ATPase FtsK/SpoIIIE